MGSYPRGIILRHIARTAYLGIIIFVVKRDSAGYNRGNVLQRKASIGGYYAERLGAIFLQRASGMSF